MLGADHRELVGLIEAALAADPHLVQVEGPAPVGGADVAVALEPDRAWVAVAFHGRYAVDGDQPDATFFVKSLEKRAEAIERIVRPLAEHHRARLEGVGETAPMLVSDLADQVGVHASTVVRVLTGKVVRFEWVDRPLSEVLPFTGR